MFRIAALAVAGGAGLLIGHPSGRKLLSYRQELDPSALVSSRSYNWRHPERRGRAAAGCQRAAGPRAADAGRGAPRKRAGNGLASQARKPGLVPYESSPIVSIPCNRGGDFKKKGQIIRQPGE